MPTGVLRPLASCAAMQPAPDAHPTPPPGWQRVHWHAGAPPKPALGAPCNGCGLCCLAEPCPLGMLLSRRRSGPCAALRWSDAQQRYLCGALADAAQAVAAGGGWRARAWQRLLRRWIAAGDGCDADLHAVEAGQ